MRILTFIILLSSCISKDTTTDIGSDYKSFQSTPAWELAKAVAYANVDEIQAIAKKNKNLVDYREPVYGKTLLTMAVHRMNFSSVKVLLELGANPNIQYKPDGTSALMVAAHLGEGGFNHPYADPRYLVILLKYGGDPNAVQKSDSIKGNHTFFTPLIFACMSRVYEYAKILVDAGANVNFRNKYGFSPLYAATVGGNPDIVMYLLEHGADFKQPMYTTVKGEKKYILDALYAWKFDKGSEYYKKQEKIRLFLKEKGIK